MNYRPAYYRHHTEKFQTALNAHRKRRSGPPLHLDEEQIFGERNLLVDTSFQEYPSADGDIYVTEIKPQEHRHQQCQDDHYVPCDAFRPYKLGNDRIDIRDKGILSHEVDNLVKRSLRSSEDL